MNESMFPVVSALSTRVKLLLLSNTNAVHVEWLLPRLPVLAKFDRLLLSNELGCVKPEPAIYRAALDAAGTAPDETAFFDDIPAFDLLVGSSETRERIVAGDDPRAIADAVSNVTDEERAIHDEANRP